MALTKLDWTTPRPIIAIRADDGADETYTDLYPMLAALGVPATISVIPWIIGKDGFCTAAQLNEMEADGWGFAMHGGWSEVAWDGESDPDAPWKLKYYNADDVCNLKDALDLAWETWKTKMAAYSWTDANKPKVAVVPNHDIDIECVPSVIRAGYRYLTSPQVYSGANYEGISSAGGYNNWGIFNKLQEQWWNRYRLKLFCPFLTSTATQYTAQMRWAIATKSPMVILIHPNLMDAAALADLQAAVELGIEHGAVFTTLDSLFDYCFDPRNPHLTQANRNIIPHGVFDLDLFEDSIGKIDSRIRNGCPIGWGNRPAKWAVGIAFNAGDKIYHEGAQYTCQAGKGHTSDAEKEPGTAGGAEYWGDSTGIPTYVRANADGGPPSGNDYLTMNLTLNNQAYSILERTIKPGRWYKVEWYAKDGPDGQKPYLYYNIVSGSTTLVSTVYLPSNTPSNAHADWFFFRDYIWVPFNGINAKLTLNLATTSVKSLMLAHFADIAVYETDETDSAYDWDASEEPRLN